jgi:hypothetical protein
MKVIKQIIVISGLLILVSCGSVPPEFLTSMEKERDGIHLLKERHKQAVTELSQNWYNERLARMDYIKQLEVAKITLKVKDPLSNQDITVVLKDKLLKLDTQFSEAKDMLAKIRDILIQGYSDTDNWKKLAKIHAINLEMTRSLIELNEAQRKLYADLVGESIPFPTDFINEETKKVINKIN